MKLRNTHPAGDIALLIPGDPRGQFEVKAGAVFDATREQALLLLDPWPNPNFEPADKAAHALVAAPAAGKEK